MNILKPHEYYQVGSESRLPEDERKRRLAIGDCIQAQLDVCWKREQIAWRAIGQPQTDIFLGLDWKEFPKIVDEYVDKSTFTPSFALLSALSLSVVPPDATEKYLQFNHRATDRWVFDQYRRCCALSVHNFNQKTSYHVPLIEVTTRAQSNHQLESRDPRDFMPLQDRLPRLTVFPQTRFSFLEDAAFSKLYPFPKSYVKIMAHRLLKWFQGNSGFYNTLAEPFVEANLIKSFQGDEYQYIALMYPVVGREGVRAYKRRKASELVLKRIQDQNLKEFPAISQARYARLFDFHSETSPLIDPVSARIAAAAMQSGRALFEYSCADLETVDLDAKQAYVLEQEDLADAHLIQIEPLWAVIFPSSNQVCVYRNESIEDRESDSTNHLYVESADAQSPRWASILLHAINQIDAVHSARSQFLSRYRVILARLQVRIRQVVNLADDRTLVRSLNNYIAEVSLLLDPLQAQINVLEKINEQIDLAEDRLALQEAIRERRLRRDAVVKLQERAQASQELLIQLQNSETSYRQSQLAEHMQKETAKQIELAHRAERLNRSILVFTVVTVIFLPLSFFTSYFGMNTSDIRNTTANQGFFWAVAAPISFIILAGALWFALGRQLFREWQKQRNKAANARDLEESKLA